jgi:hypothetical protein
MRTGAAGCTEAYRVHFCKDSLLSCFLQKQGCCQTGDCAPDDQAVLYGTPLGFNA